MPICSSNKRSVIHALCWSDLLHGRTRRLGMAAGHGVSQGLAYFKFRFLRRPLLLLLGPRLMLDTLSHKSIVAINVAFALIFYLKVYIYGF